MKECNNCGKEYEDDIQFCEECGSNLADNTELQTNEQNSETIEETPQKTFCIYCGGEIASGLTYCSKCGKSSVEEGKKHCVQCGTVLVENQKFCGTCGQKVSSIIIPREMDSAVKTVKKINPKKMIVIVIAIVISIALILVGKTVIPKIFVSADEYLAQGNYEKAYDKAKKDQKEDVLIENLIATICAEAKTSLKNEDSFKLRQAWYDKNEDRIVLRIQGKNSFGGDVTNYWYYTFDDEEQEYQLWTTVSDFEEEETYSWDDTSEILEKILTNAAKEIIQEIIEKKENELDSKMIDRINELNSQKLLDDVELLEETKTLYPEEEKDEEV